MEDLREVVWGVAGIEISSAKRKVGDCLKTK
jgi:hypothetical protein